MTTIPDLLAIPIDAEERTVLADLRQRYSGDRFEREAVAYLTGAVQRVAPRVRRASAMPPPAWLVADDSPALAALDSYEREMWRALVAGWLLEHRGVAVVVCAPQEGEEPVCNLGGRVDAKGLSLAVSHASAALGEAPAEDAALVASGTECADAQRNRVVTGDSYA